MNILVSKILACVPWSKTYKNEKKVSCAIQDKLRQARKQDSVGNYDLDGVSFDGEALYIGGRLKDSQTYLKDSQSL